MSLALQKADAFLEDFALQALWYVRQAGPHAKLTWFPSNLAM
jgi:hypothetical protein